MRRAVRLALCVAVAICLDAELEAEGEEGQCDANGENCQGLKWKPQTLSVVLPCAGEGEFAQKTIQSVSDSVPGGSGGEILANIVVVDDGSKPALSKSHLPKAFREQFAVTLIRNKRAVGLIRAKAMGARAATGDVIVFFDCHVAPQEGWYEEFLRESAENYRRIVVPQITDLDIDTWKERNRHLGASKCYLTWDADFKWFTSTRSELPVLSGGLLGISRRWWNETGGYDEGMQGWGGENIDQSLRTWLCGGEIKSLSKAFVAHMWRVPHDPRTQSRYAVNVMHTIQNRARAARGWFDDFAQKLRHYPDMGFAPGGDMSAFGAVRDRLGCRPFAWFLWRFRDVYEDGGLLPNSTFRIRHRASGKCLTYLGPAGTHPRGSDMVELQPCGRPGRRRWANSPPDPQRWHLANQEPGTGKCCSGLRLWSTDQCLGQGQTSVCDIAGRSGRAGLSGEGRWPSLAPGQLVVGGQCLEFASKRLVLLQCLPAGTSAGREAAWEEVEHELPLETQLYRRALAEKPELFSPS